MKNNKECQALTAMFHYVRFVFTPDPWLHQHLLSPSQPLLPSYTTFAECITNLLWLLWVNFFPRWNIGALHQPMQNTNRRHFSIYDIIIIVVRTLT